MVEKLEHCALLVEHSGETGALCALWMEHSGETGALCALWMEHSGETRALCALWMEHGGETGALCALWMEHSGETGALCALLMEHGAAAMENNSSGDLITKKKNDPAVQQLMLFEQQFRAGTQGATCSSLLISALLAVTKMCEQTESPSTDEQTVVCACNGTPFRLIKS
ncbi:hypothetical protein STEG23_035076 [Scotinomys teguina]